MKRKNERIITDQRIEEYGQWLERCEKSGETIKKYRQYLKQFKEYTGDEPVTKEMVLLWKADLRRRITPVTINCVIAALNGFFKYYRWDGCESKFLKISKSSFYPERKELSKNEYKRLVKTAIANGNERLALVLETICASGIRVSELIHLELSDVNMAVGFITCRDEYKERAVPFGRVAKEALSRYLETARPALVKGGDAPWLFINCSGGLMSRQGFWKIVKYYGEKAGIQEDITPHTLRHSFAAHLIRGGADIHAVQAMLGHSDSTTTHMYAAYSGNTVGETYRAALPRK